MSRDLPLPPNSTIPEDAKRVFEGKIFDVYHWDQELYDGSRATFEKLRRDDTALVIPVTKDGKLLLLQQEQPGKPPFLSFAGGRVERGERGGEAAKRELLEETGCVANELSEWFHMQPLSKIDWTVFVYIAKGCHRIQEQNLDAGEKISLKIVTFEEFVVIASDDPQFQDIEITQQVLQARLSPERMLELKKLFFG